MKFVLTFLATVIVSQALGWTINTPIGQKINLTRNMCVQQTGLSANYIEMIQLFNYPNIQETQKYMRCVFENLELWDDRTGIRLDRMMNESGDILDAIRECNDIFKTSNADEWLYNTVYCITKGRMGDVLENITGNTEISTTTTPTTAPTTTNTPFTTSPPNIDIRFNSEDSDDL